MSEDRIKELEESLADAVADLRRAQDEYSTCLLNDPVGCATEQDAVAAAERRAKALRKKLAEAEWA